MVPPLVRQTTRKLEDRGYETTVTKFDHECRFILDFNLFVSQEYTKSTSSFVFDKAGKLKHLTLRLPPLEASREAGRRALEMLFDSIVPPYNTFMWLAETERGLEPHFRFVPEESKPYIPDVPLTTIIRLDRLAAQQLPEIARVQ